MPTIQYKEGGDYPELPVRTPLLVKVIESNYVTEANPFYGKTNEKTGKTDEREERDVVKVVMEVVEGDFTGSRIWSNFTASINEKSKLLPFLQAVHDHELTREELETFDTDDLVGMRVWVTGSYNPKDTDHKFLRPDSFFRVEPETSAKPAKKPAAKKAAAKPEAKPAVSTRDAALAALKAKQAAELAALEGDGETTTEDGSGEDGFDPDETPF